MALRGEDSFISHLLELRDRLLRAVIALVVVFVALFPWANDIYALLAQPLLKSLPAGGRMIATEVTTPFFVPVKVTLMTAFVIALPYVLYQVWSFVAPGLYKHERRLAVPLIASSVLLFLAGMAFAYFLVFPVVFGFIIGFAPEGVEVATDIGKYLDFVLTMFMAFGITFEVPIAVILLVLTNMVTVEKLREIRPYVIVGAFVVGAIFTPPDVVSQFMLAVPLWILYEVGILFSAWFIRRKPAAEDPDAEDPDAFRPLSEDELDRQLDEIEKVEKGQ
jgi:sec-independent protein translocase protein TatC